MSRSLLPFLAIAAFTAALAAQQSATGNRTPAPTISVKNDKLDLTISLQGGRFTKLLLDGNPMSPLHTIGHFLALDGFGPPSPQETAAGIPFHGEASRQPEEVVSKNESGPMHSVTLHSVLPLVQESLTRTIELADGESVIRVSSELESALNIDRPISWAEHATLGPPFLEQGDVFVDMPVTNCRVRPYKPGPIPGELVYDRDFKWPLAPTNDFGKLDIRYYAVGTKNLDLASCQIDPDRTLGFATAINTAKHLLLGYLFPREDYPWIMNWLNNTGDAKAARGMEFSTQPFDVSHRETVEMNQLFGTPTFKWLPAKSKIQSHFLMFYTTIPDGFTRVDDVKLAAGKLTIEDRTAGKQVVLATSQTL